MTEEAASSNDAAQPTEDEGSGEQAAEGLSQPPQTEAPAAAAYIGAKEVGVGVGVEEERAPEGQS